MGHMVLDHRRIEREVNMGLVMWAGVVLCQGKEKDQVVLREDSLQQAMSLVVLVLTKRENKM